MRQPVLKVTHNANATNTSNFSTGIDFNKKANRTISKLSVDLRKELRDHNHQNTSININDYDNTN